MPVDIEKYTTHLRNNAKRYSQGMCAKYVRLALAAGGAPTNGRHPGHAKDWGPVLLRLGFHQKNPAGRAHQKVRRIERGQPIVLHIAQAGKSVAVFADLAKRQHLAISLRPVDARLGAHAPCEQRVRGPRVKTGSTSCS